MRKRICEEALPHSCKKKFKLQICYVTSGFLQLMRTLPLNKCLVLIWRLEMIDKYQVKTWAKFNKNRKVCSQGLVLSPKISLIVLPRHLSKSEQT